MSVPDPSSNAAVDKDEAIVLSVLIAAYNEERTVGEVLSRVLATPLPTCEVVIVDDGSVDRTANIIETIASQEPRIKFVRLSKNRGKTAAIARAIAAARGELLVIQDADFEYDPQEIPHLLAPIHADKADVVYGSRFLNRDPTRSEYASNRVGNKFITWWSNLFTGYKLTDVETCLKVFRAGLIKPLILTSSGFGMEIELTAMIARTNARIVEVPISYEGRSFQEGKKISVWDGLAATWYVVYYGFVTRWSKRTRSYIRVANEFLTSRGA